MEELINLLKASKLKTVEKDTGIPYTRMHKWITTTAKPKTEDYNILAKYFNLRTNSINEQSTELAEEQAEVLESKGIPMYNSPGSASGVEIYTDRDSTKVVGYLNFPGITKGSFALPVYGNSMSPTLEGGVWAILRPIENKYSINWGQIYYIEYDDYRVFKRLLATDNDDEVILWSDNQHDLINGKPKHAPRTIKKSEIRNLSLVTDIYKKSNH